MKVFVNKSPVECEVGTNLFEIVSKTTGESGHKTQPEVANGSGHETQPDVTGGCRESDGEDRSGNDMTGIAVAVDNKVVPKSLWKTVILEEGAKITVIRAVCGG